MAEYMIREEKFESVSKKINSIKNKCDKLGLPFKFEILGEEFKNIGSESTPIYAKFIKIDVEGRAYIADYEAVAVAECTKNGNVIRKINYDIEVPEKYYHSGCICEHCNSNRYRKEVLIIRNVNTDEYKQVGKACCKLYTGNLDASWVAMLGELYDTLIKEEEDCDYLGDYSGTRYYDLKHVVSVACGIISKVGYFSSSTNLPTKVLVSEYLWGGCNEINKSLKDYGVEFKDSDFDGMEEYAEKVIEHYGSKSVDENDFIRNVSIIIKNGYVSRKELGFVSYLPWGYKKDMEKEEERRKREEEWRLAAEKRAKSDEIGYFGEVGKRYKNEKVESIKEVGYYTTEWGITNIYKITLESGHELTWKTSSTPLSLEEYLTGHRPFTIETVAFTVKEHGEYKGHKQTVVTRCKFTEKKEGK